jgi:hypothetical protein
VHGDVPAGDSDITAGNGVQAPDAYNLHIRLVVIKQLCGIYQVGYSAQANFGEEWSVSLRNLRAFREIPITVKPVFNGIPRDHKYFPL